MIGFRLAHTLTSDVPSSVHLLRELSLSSRGPLKLALPRVLPLFRAENERMMKALKDFAESQAAATQ